MVKESFINTDDNDTYYVDKYGDKVTSSGVQVGYVSVAQELDSKGIAYDEVDANRTVTAGSKKYISLGKEHTNADIKGSIGVDDATVFFYKNKN